MRKVINLNQDWKFIQQDAGLPDSLPVHWQTVQLPHSWNAVDGRTATDPMTEADTGMQKPSRRPDSRWPEEGYLWRSWLPDSRRRYM